MDPDKVFQDILSAINNISNSPASPASQEEFALDIAALSGWLAEGGRIPPAAEETVGSEIAVWLRGARAAIYVLRGYPGYPGS